MKFSFIIPVYEGYSVVARCLDSIAAQTCKDYEVIVVNDGFDPRMWKMVKEGTPSARYFEHPFVGRAGGFMGIDVGIQNTRDSDFIYILNGDNKIYPTFAEKMHNPDAHILTCGVKMNDMVGHILTGMSFAKGSFDRANYAIQTDVARRVGYKDFPMQQDDYYFFMACYEYISEKGHVNIHHVNEVLAEHN